MLTVIYSLRHLVTWSCPTMYSPFETHSSTLPIKWSKVGSSVWISSNGTMPGTRAVLVGGMITRSRNKRWVRPFVGTSNDGPHVMDREGCNMYKICGWWEVRCFVLMSLWKGVWCPFHNSLSLIYSNDFYSWKEIGEKIDEISPISFTDFSTNKTGLNAPDQGAPGLENWTKCLWSCLRSLQVDMYSEYVSPHEFFCILLCDGRFLCT